MTATIVNLPDRSNAITYGEDDVAEVLSALFEAGTGQGVVTDDEQDTETKARVRARKMAEYLKRDHADALDGYKVRTHVIAQGEDGSEEFLPVLSIKLKASDEDTDTE